VPPGDHRVTLLTKPGCHLCDDARDVVRQVCAELAVAWDEVDITGSPRLWTAHHDRIPVTMVDGQEHDFWRVDAGRLRTELLR
jgi:hypothetical protein